LSAPLSSFSIHKSHLFALPFIHHTIYPYFGILFSAFNCFSLRLELILMDRIHNL
jgi:hypothetical protein